MNQLQRFRRVSSVRASVLIVFFLSFATIGTYLMMQSFAATESVSIEAETGTKAGNVTQVTDSNASAGMAVQFGTVQSVLGVKKLLLFEQSPIPVDSATANAVALNQLPYDGAVMSISASSTVHSSTRVPLSALRSQLASYSSASFTKMTDNFLIVYATPAGEYTNYGSVVAQNMADLAQAAKDAGFTGILFDNEEYFGPTWAQSVACPGLSLAACEINARDAGTAVAVAMLARWPQMKLMTTYGPWISEGAAGTPLGNCCGYYDVAFANQEVGWYLEGLAEGAPGHYIDGGEIYTQTSQASLQTAYDWLKHTFPQVSPIVSSSFKSQYNVAASQAFGIYDFSVPYRGKTSDPATWKRDITDALKVVDEYVWAYTERFNWSNNPNSSTKPTVTADWLQATIDGRAAAR